MLKITVEGRTGDGKTTVANLIATALEAHGIKVVLHDTDSRIAPEELPKKAGSLARRYDHDNPVTVQTVQVRR